MLQLALLVTAVLVQANGQIIFPDEYAAILKAYALEDERRLNASRNIAASPSFQFSPSNDDSGTFYPLPAAASASSFGPPGTQGFMSQGTDPEAEYWNSHVNNILSNGITKFALDMDHAIYRSHGTHAVGERPNVVFSPLSIVSTLAMVLLGSAGVTFEQVSRILGLESGVDISAHSELVHLMLGTAFKSILTRGDPASPEVTLASGMFVQNGYPIRNEFKEISREAYNNEIINLDFIRKTVESTRTINDWVQSKTHGKISTILDEPIDPSTKLIIASALYFSGEWNQYFFPKSTARKPFSIAPNKFVTVDMMYNGGDFLFYEDKTLRAKILGLPYKGNAANDPTKPEAMMYVLLPTAKDVEALRRLEEGLTTENLENMINQMKTEVCVFALPRMKLSSTLNLNKALRSLGLTSLFDQRASNLGVLSQGYNETEFAREPTIITSRIGEDDDSSTTTLPRNNRQPTDSPKNRKNYFSFTDEQRRYSVQQWDSGVIIEQIPQSFHRKRSADRGGQTETTGSQGTRPENNVPYDISVESESKKTKLRFVEIGDDKYRFDQMPRLKRQVRPIDQDYVNFIESRKTFPNYGLDALRNSPNLVNPGLFASDVLHKVEMDVTETGTQAAAATSVSIQRGGDIKRLLANRPFLFFIRHESTKIILFWGTVNKPTPYY